jgi:aspartyl-tRNA(Asn)/glutamyl-tRNA(Gln) amidotransferase subunit A
MPRPGDTFNAFIADDAAMEADSGSPTGPLADLTCGVKDNIDVAGFPTRAGLGRRDTPPAANDAACVRALRAAGARILGKLGMDEAALGATGDNPHTGRVLNPRDPSRSPGGSSSGPAAAVAAGLCDLALGTDTLGSVRIPASYCGVIGFKPTPVEDLQRGIVPLAPMLDAIGLLARDLDILRGAARALTPGRADDVFLPRGLRWGVPRQLGEIGLEPDIDAAFAAWLEHARRLGVIVETIDMAEWSPMATARAGFLLAERKAARHFASALASGDPALSPALRKLLAYGRDCDADKIAAATRTAADAGDAWVGALRRFDAIALPTTPHVAFRISERAPADQAAFTAPANCAGAPAISLPAGCDRDGMPIGLQLVAAPGRDATLLAIAALLRPR